MLDRLPQKYKEVDYYVMTAKRIVYIAIFAWFCYLDHIIGSAQGYMQAGLKIYTGILIAVIILMNYKLGDYLKFPYAIWIVLFFIGRQLVLKEYYNNCLNNVALVSVLWGIGVYGILVIRLFYLYVIEKKRPKMNWVPFLVCAVVLIAMAVIRPDYSWTRDAGIALVLFYLTDFSEKELRNLYSGMVDGLILGFILCQGFAWLHRPYMNEARYIGMYCNTGMNALFYIFVYSAILCKWYQMKLKKRSLWLRIPLVVLAGLVLATTLYTGSRTALICIVLATALFLVFQLLSGGKRRWAEVLIDGIALIVAMIVCIVPAFVLIRYVPEQMDDYVFFAYDKEYERTIEFEEASEEIFGRMFWFSEGAAEAIQRFVGNLFDTFLPEMKVQASDWAEEYYNPLEEVYIEPGTDNAHPLLTMEEAEDPVRIRTSIYEYFIKHLDLVGKKDNIQGVWLTEEYYAYHTHNFFLQVAYDFGIIVAALLVIVVLLIYNGVLAGLWERECDSRYFLLFCTVVFVTAFLGFGMLEITWTYGQIGFTLFWLMQYAIYHREEDVPYP